MERLRMGDPRQQVIETYRFCLGKFAKLGFPRPDQYTELEYADSCYDRLSPYLKGSVDLDEMTDIFMDARYEGREIPEETADRFAEIYPSILMAVTSASLDELYKAAEKRLQEYTGGEEMPDADDADEEAD